MASKASLCPTVQITVPVAAAEEASYGSLLINSRVGTQKMAWLL